MKSTLLKALAAASSLALVAAVPTPAGDATDAATAANPSKSGTQFTIDGKTGYFAGTNSYWIPFLTNNADVDLVMGHLQSSGLKVLRVWGFNDVNTVPGSGTVWFQSFVSGQQPQINTGANGLQRLDYVVQSAAAHDIKLIINFVNNWTDYGGMAAYMKYYGLSTSAGTSTSTNANWYASAAAQAQYQKYISAVVSRYKTSPAIFAWELANEPRCNACPTSTITNWATTTSKYIKSLDPNHMVTMGDEGFGLAGDGSYPYQTGEGLNFTTNLAIPSIDFGTMHLYPESWGVSPDTTWGAAWIANHAKACVAANKPCLLEEYGVPTASGHCATESVWQNQSLALKTKGMGGDMFWQDGDTLSTGKTSDDGNTIFYGTSDWTCLVTNHVKAIGS